MSRVNSSATAAAAATAAEVASSSSAPAAMPTEPLAAPMAADEASLFESGDANTRSSLSEVHTRNVVVDTKLSATELNLGKSVPLSRNLAAVFADGIEGVTAANTKVVITGITLENVYSDVPSRVAVSANLFQSKVQQTGLKNEAGWLYSQQSSELASEAAEHVAYGGDGSFVNLCSLLPLSRRDTQTAPCTHPQTLAQPAPPSGLRQHLHKGTAMGRHRRRYPHHLLVSFFFSFCSAYPKCVVFFVLTHIILKCCNLFPLTVSLQSLWSAKLFQRIGTASVLGTCRRHPIVFCFFPTLLFTRRPFSLSCISTSQSPVRGKSRRILLSHR